MSINKIIGETLAYVDIDCDGVMLTTRSGKVFRMHHAQDCCESVSIYDMEGNLHSLIGKPLVQASETVTDDPKPPEHQYAESFTWTVYEFKTDSDTCVMRWFGESNGYYSEDVDFVDFTIDAVSMTPDGWHGEPKGDDWLVIADEYEMAGDHRKAAMCRALHAQESIKAQL